MIKSYEKLTFKDMVNFANPKTFTASVLPAIFGILISLKLGYSINLFKSFSLVLSCTFFQASVNTLNDYSDFVKGVDSKEDNLSESDNIFAYKNIDPNKVKLLGILYLILGVFLGLIGLIDLNKYTLIIASIGILTILSYSNGPLALSYLPVGEISSGLVMGFLIPLGIYSVISSRVNKVVFLYSLPFIIGITLIMMSNNGSDIEKDKKASRNTLAVVMGRSKFLKLYRFFIIMWLIITLALMVKLSNIVIFMVCFIIFIINYKNIRNLYKLNLEPENRITQMASIGKANLLINGLYVLCILLSLVRV